MQIKIGDIRLLNITIIKDGNKIYEGKSEDVPVELKNMTYKNIKFDGVDVLIEI